MILSQFGCVVLLLAVLVVGDIVPVWLCCVVLAAVLVVGDIVPVWLCCYWWCLWWVILSQFGCVVAGGGACDG